MPIPSAPTFRLPLVTLLSASALLGACGSSGGDDPLPPEDATGGDMAVVPENGASMTLDDGVAANPGGTPDAGADAPGDGANETPTTGTDVTDGGAEETPTTGADVPDAGADGTPTDGAIGSVSGQATSYGIVEIEQPSGGDDGFASGGFFRTDLEITAQQAVASFVPEPDTCTVTRIEPDAGGLPDIDRPGFDSAVEFLSAGETITFTSPAGTWLTLPRREGNGIVLYDNGEEGLPQPVPSGLSVDIPGDAFPAFSEVEVPDVSPLLGVMPSGADATADTTFRWQAGRGDPSVFIEISVVSGGGFALPAGLPDDILEALPEGGIPGLGGGPSTVLDCFARDDGEFALPAAIRAELGSDFSGIPSYARLGVAAVQQGDALLLVLNASSVD